MSGDGRSEAEGERAARRGGPQLVFVPLCALFAVAWWISRPESGLRPSAPPPRTDPEAIQEVLWGEARAGGVTLTARLTPADVARERAEFQSLALERRYGLEAGALFRLRLEARAAETGADGASPSEAAFDLRSVGIADDSGAALVPLALASPERPPDHPPQQPPHHPMDPLATLLAPPSAPLRPGQGIDLFLWGKAPGAGARVTGLGEEGGEVAVALVPRQVRAGDIGGPLARLDPAAVSPNTGGKSAPAASSTAAGKRPDEPHY